MNGGDGMIIFYEYLINEALRIVDLKGTVDDIKAGNDLKEINRIISCLEVNINICVERRPALSISLFWYH